MRATAILLSSSASAYVLDSRGPSALACFNGKGEGYLGLKADTETGRRCKNWNDVTEEDWMAHAAGQVKEVDVNGKKLKLVGDHNYCRNVDPAALEQPGCFTVDPKMPFEVCGVEKCDPKGPFAKKEGWYNHEAEHIKEHMQPNGKDLNCKCADALYGSTTTTKDTSVSFLQSLLRECPCARNEVAKRLKPMPLLQHKGDKDAKKEEKKEEKKYYPVPETGTPKPNPNEPLRVKELEKKTVTAVATTKKQDPCTCGGLKSGNKQDPCTCGGKKDTVSTVATKKQDPCTCGGMKDGKCACDPDDKKEKVVAKKTVALKAAPKKTEKKEKKEEPKTVNLVKQDPCTCGGNKASVNGKQDPCTCGGNKASANGKQDPCTCGGKKEVVSTVATKKQDPCTCAGRKSSQDPCTCGGEKESVATDFLLRHGAVDVKKATTGLSMADALASMYTGLEH